MTAPTTKELVPWEESQKQASFAERYRPDGDDSWIQEVDELDIDDLDNLDPSMLAEAERRAYRLAAEMQIVDRCRDDLFIYMSMRFGQNCPEPERVIYPHQELVINDLMRLTRPDALKSYSLTAPRGFVKTSTVSDWLEWYLGNNPTMKSMIVGATERTSIKRLGPIKKNIMLDPLFRAVFPDVEIDPERANNQTNMSLRLPSSVIDVRSSTIEAYGVNSSPEGGRSDVLWFDDVCWVPGTDIWTPGGPTPIEAINVGDVVYNRYGAPEVVTRTYEHESPGSVISITTRHLTNTPLQLTANHRLWARRAYTQANGIVRRGRSPEGKAEYIPAGELQVGDWLWVPFVGSSEAEVEGVDEDLAWLLGYYTAEGGFRSGSTSSFHFTCHEDEVEYQDRVSRIFVSRWGASVSWYHRSGRRSCEAYVMCPEFEDYARLCGDGAKNKKVPPFLFNANRRLRAAYLRGLWDGDGCYRQSRYDFVTVSSQLASGVQMLLLSLGVVAKRYCADRSSMVGANFDLWSVYFSSTVQDTSLPMFQLSRGSRRAAGIVAGEGGWWVQITSIAMTDYNGSVYNLEVGQDHSYVASGVGAANCTYENSVKQPRDRESIKDKLRVTWFPLRTGPNMLVVWTYTPWHDLDASMEIYRKKHGWSKRFIKVSSDFTHLVDMTDGSELSLPAKRWNPVTQQFERWWGEKELHDLWRNEPEEFRVAYWLETVTAEHDMANWDSKVLWGDPQSDKEGAIQFGFSQHHSLYYCPIIAMGVDLAFGQSSSAKNTAITIVGMREDGKRVVLDAEHGHGWGTTRKIEEIIKLYRRWSPDIIVVEDNAAQSMLVDLLTDSRIFDSRVEPFTTDFYKEAKLRVIANEYKDGWWIIPFDDERTHGQGQGCKCSRCLMVKEMENYPKYDTSDVLMSSMFAKEGLKMLGGDKEGPRLINISL